MSTYNGPSYNQHAANTSNQKILELVEQDKKTLQRLKNNVLNLNKMVENLCSKEANVDNAKKTFKLYSEQMKEDYETLETDAITLQNHTLVNPEMNRLQTFLLDALADPSNNEIYNKACKIANSYDTSTAYYNFAIEFLKIFTSSHTSKKLPKLTPYIYSNNQAVFEENLNKWISMSAPGKTNQLKIKFIEHSVCGSIVEFLIYYPSNVVGGVLKMKMLFLVSNGQFEYTQIVAPFEEWTYTDANRTQVDISVQSKYESYRRLSAQANATGAALSSFATVDSKSYINHFLLMFIKTPTFEYPCRNCKKYLRDFMPAISDQRDRRACYHESCR